jgi:hypothetical protein
MRAPPNRARMISNCSSPRATPASRMKRCEEAERLYQSAL